MAFMAPRLTPRKNVYEQVIVARRNKLEDYHQNWNNNSKFFKNSDIRTSKLSAWTSDKSYQHSMGAFQALKDKEEKQIKLEKRRHKIAKLYEEERIQHHAELSGMSSDNVRRIDDMRERAGGLKSAREEKRKVVAAERLYDHWRLNHPDLRKVESEQHKEHVITSWKDQVDENQQRLATARKEKEDFDHRAEMERLSAIRREEEAENAKIAAEKQLKLTLKRQMDELRAQEEEGRRLKREEDELIHHQWQVDEMDRQQTHRQEEQNKQQFGRLLLKQHVAQMKRKSQLVQQELEQDLELLRSLLAQEKDDSEMRLAERAQAKADAAWMKEVLDEQMKIEKAREAEMEMIYQHEASRMWEKREDEWTKERAARQRLMKEVLESRQDQIEHRLEEIQTARKESIDERQRLIEEMEVANQMTHREAQAQSEAITARRKEIQQQIVSQREEREAESLRLHLEDEDQEEEDRQEEEMLRQETARMAIGGYTQRDVGRRKQAWL